MALKRCKRCGGFEVYEVVYTGQGVCDAIKCVNCGGVHYPTMTAKLAGGGGLYPVVTVGGVA